MATEQVWRFIESGHLPPATNMAVDEALIEIYRNTGEPTFRIYGWSPCGFSLGYSQKAEAVLDIEACRRDGIPVVNRITGGGIIFHCTEVTYSIVCSEKDIGSPLTVKDGYRIICSFLLESYRRYGLDPCFSIDCSGGNKAHSTFCFSSFEDYDILIGGRKIGGNAQKRIKKIILQHGSVPLKTDFPSVLRYVREPVSSSIEKTASLEEVVGREVKFEEFADVMQKSFCSAFSARLEEKGLTEQEKEIVNAYEKSKL